VISSRIDRRHGALASAVLCAFDLLELDRRDLRREPIEKRMALLAKLLKGSHLSIVLNEHYEEDGEIVFREACRLGCEGIVSNATVGAFPIWRWPRLCRTVWGSGPQRSALHSRRNHDWQITNVGGVCRH
jgi:hypothetical protein